MVHKTVVSVGAITFEIIKAPTGEAESADTLEEPVYEKSLFASVTHKVKDPEDVSLKVEYSTVDGGHGYILLAHSNVAIEKDKSVEPLERTKIRCTSANIFLL